MMKSFNETWRPVSGFPNYLVSDHGQIKSLARQSFRRWKKEQILRPQKDTNGYFRVGLMVDGKQITKKVHSLVAEAFCQGKTAAKKTVNHRDGDKANNFASNLEWASYSENLKHSFDIGLRRGMSGSAHPNSKITEDIVKEIRSLFETRSNKEIAKMFGCHVSNISKIKTGRAWRHVGV